MLSKVGDNILSPDEYRERSKIKMAWRGIFFFTIVFTSLILFLGNEVNSIYSYSAALVTSLIGMLFLHLKKNPDPIFLFFSITGTLICQISCWYIPESIHYPDFVWMCICSLIAFLAKSKKFGLLMLSLNVIGTGLFIFFKHNEHVETIIQATPEQLSGAFLELILAFFILGYLLYQFTTYQSIWENAYRDSNKTLALSNIKVKEQNDQNIILLKEIHHRVKNNLQVIVSLLRLQKYELKTEESQDQFQEAINRILVMSSIHQRLYQQNDLTNINLETHLTELIEELKVLFDDGKEIIINIDCKIQFISLKTMVPLGLLINELLSNSFKYAFKNKTEGQIDIKIIPTKTGFTIYFKDNGEWIVDGSRNGFGLELIEVFTSQLNGKRSFKTDNNGTEYIFQLEPID